jgi:hypothetical protein
VEVEQIWGRNEEGDGGGLDSREARRGGLGLGGDGLYGVSVTAPCCFGVGERRCMIWGRVGGCSSSAFFFSDGSGGSGLWVALQKIRFRFRGSRSVNNGR